MTSLNATYNLCACSVHWKLSRGALAFVLTCYLLTASHNMSLQEQFDQAAGNVKKLKSLPSDSDLLELYALFKQATVGDADPANKPGMLDLKGKAKFEAWTKKKGTSKDDAQKAYIAKVESLIASIGLQ